MRIEDIEWQQGAGAVVAIGNFDGVHPGHAGILARLTDEARARGLASVVLTFDPHPVEFFRGGHLDRLTTADEKVALLRARGVDHVCVLAFDAAFARLTAEDLVGALIARIGLEVLVLGPNASIGRNREGDALALDRILRERGKALVVVSPHKVDGHWVSSSRIREALREGDVREAARLLARPYALEGRVASGHAIGRNLGTPTLNLADIGTMLPADGVYATRTQVAGEWLPSVTNVGNRPTFHDSIERVVETHILDRKFENAPSRVAVQFVERLRAEKKFAGALELRDAIAVDLERARRILR